MLIKSILFIVLCNFTYSQKNNDSNQIFDEKNLSVNEFQEAKIGYLRLSFSKDYTNLREASQDFAYKLGNYYDLKSLDSYEDFEKWIPSVIEKTKFKNTEEACTLMKVCFQLQEKIETENSRIFALIKRANKEQLKEILAPEFATEEELIEIQDKKQ